MLYKNCLGFKRKLTNISLLFTGQAHVQGNGQHCGNN